MRSHKKCFTLVELIIVITILAILAITVFMLLTKWLGKSRDGRRMSDLSVIDNALQIYSIEKSTLPMPTNFIIFTEKNLNIYQGEFDPSGMSLNKKPVDPTTNSGYTYSVLKSGLGYYYQIGSDFENNIGSGSNTTKILGNYQFDPSLPSTIVSKINTTTSIFDPNTCFVLDQGINNINGSSCIGKKDIFLNSYDPRLAAYYDMQTTYNSGGTNYLKDISGNGNSGTLTGEIDIGGTGGQNSMATYFDGVSGDITIINDNLGITGYSWFGDGTGETVSYIFKIQPNSILDTTNMLIMNRNREMTTCVGTGYLIFRDNKGNGITFTDYPIKIGEFYNFTATYSFYDGVVKLYINGKLIGKRLEGIFQPGGSSGQFDIGVKAGGCSGVYFNGILDELKIYKRILSESEIAQFAGAGGF